MLPQRARRSGGFTYLSLIILVAIIGLVSASALKLGAVLQRSRAERELLDIGAAFSDALQSYADATPPGQPPQPRSLKDLLKDPRFPGVRRHLRKLFVDPMTGKPEWGIVYLGDKIGVLAVYSLSNDKPVKIGNFPTRFQGLESRQKISEWRFAASGKSGVPTPTAPVMPQAPGSDMTGVSKPTPSAPTITPPPPPPPPPAAPAEPPPAPPAEPPPAQEPAPAKESPPQEPPPAKEPAPEQEPPAEPQPENK